MEKYIALLRGINVGAKNKVPMKELKLAFEEIYCTDVSTYINSGNVIFSSNINNINELIERIEIIIEKNFNLSIPVTVITSKKLSNVLDNAPTWWNTDNKEIYNNAIFLIPPTTIEEVFKEMGDANHDYEKIDNYGDVIFWSAYLKTFNKSRYSKIASSSINNKVTIRNANTAYKLLKLTEK